MLYCSSLWPSEETSRKDQQFLLFYFLFHVGMLFVKYNCFDLMSIEMDNKIQLKSVEISYYYLVSFMEALRTRKMYF